MTDEQEVPVAFPSITVFRRKHPELSDEEAQERYAIECAEWRKARGLDYEPRSK
ncbi:hypothetical protein HYX70_05000 [Candidatus Saccharibacteria bacterium]|nr:hypothetical protein [Candidatus Saccharibacteria bacterium]